MVSAEKEDVFFQPPFILPKFRVLGLIPNLKKQATNQSIRQ
jgi:hypothetical protein